jgi:hypothetical protein
LSIILLSALSFGLSAEEAVIQSLTDLDTENQKIVSPLNQRLGALGGKVGVGNFSYAERSVPLGSYWTTNLRSVLANLENRNFTLLRDTANADYIIQGEITVIGNTVRIYTQIVKSSDLSLLGSWPINLQHNEFIAGLLASGEREGGSRRTDVPRDSFESDSMEQPQTVTLGSWIDRTIHSTQDEDWFLIVTDRAGTIVCETSGELDTLMELYDGTSLDKLDENDDGGSGNNALIEYQVEAGKRYIVKVRGYSGEMGRYRFRAVSAETPADTAEPNDSRDQAFQVELGSSVEAYFSSSSDRDWYKLIIPAGGQRVTIYTEGRLDTYLNVYAEDGEEIADDDDSGSDYNAKITVDAPAGVLYFEVKELDGQRGRYTLRTSGNR